MRKYKLLPGLSGLAVILSAGIGPIVLFPLPAIAQIPWKCVANCGSSSGSSSGVGYSVRSGPTPQQLQSIRQKKERGEGDRGKLDVQEAKTKQEISNVTSKIGKVDYDTESFVINLTRETMPSQDPQKPK